MTISIELVPRSEASINAELEVLNREFSGVGMVNIPDLLRFDYRSWEACALATTRVERAIPHLRAMDFPTKDAGKLADRLQGLGLREVLVIRGDPPQDLSRPIHATTSAELIHALKEIDPGLRIYAAFDPYRRGLREEIDCVFEKMEAGAVGLFTQPFFDVHFMQVCADVLPDADIFWGVSPVLTAGSRRYWEVKNRAFFPSNFEPSLDWNRGFASRCLEWADESSSNLYFMPIRVNLVDYLGGLIS